MFINQDTGQIYFSSPLDATFVRNYQRCMIISTTVIFTNFYSKFFNLICSIFINIQVIQYQQLNGYKIYLGSLSCLAIILIQANNSLAVPKAPYFLRNYYSIVDREYVYRTIPLLTVTAISLNVNPLLPVTYYLVNNNPLFTIDKNLGRIYPAANLSLPVNIYNMQVIKLVFQV